MLYHDIVTLQDQRNETNNICCKEEYFKYFEGKGILQCNVEENTTFEMKAFLFELLLMEGFFI